MRVFVTGGNGFIGSALVRRLVLAGHEVRCLLRPGADVSRISDLRFERASGDVLDGAAVANGMRDCEWSMHLAAPGGWGADDPAKLFATIVDGTKNVLEAARGTTTRVVVVSTTAAVNASEEPMLFDEHTAFSVRDAALIYANAKVRAEVETRAAVENGVDAVIVNPAEVYGPNDIALGTAGNLIDFARSTPILVCDGGTSVVHVDDVVSGIVAAAELGRSGERYILGGENITITELARLVIELCDRRVPVVRVPRSVVRGLATLAIRARCPMPFNPHVVPYATRYWFVDSGKARRELGVEFRGARETIAATLRWLREAGKLG